MKTIAIDFDATITEYSGYKGKGNFGDPMPNVADVLSELMMRGWIIIIHTTRSETHQVKEYLDKNKIPYNYINFNPENINKGLNIGKPLADVYLDDRAITFKGSWTKALIDIENFKVWWRRK